ncbi:aquaporin Z [Citrobacter freundii]|nr:MULTISPECIES: aquaporin Z [Klebsiella]EGT0627975.1 aquaporin Z [Citrobacter freundii]
MSALAAEFTGTLWLVLGGCGSALLAAGFPTLGIGFAGVALAFGLSVFTMIAALGPVSGGHFNPAVSLGLWAGGRFPVASLAPYILAQTLGGAAGGGVLYAIASGFAGFDPATQGFVSNGYGALSPANFGLSGAALAEVVLTAGFVLVIMGVTDAGRPAAVAPLAIGLCLTLIHLISIPVDNTSVNPARSTATALFAGGAYLHQLWLFWLAPLAGGVLGGLFYRGCFVVRAGEAGDVGESL